MVNKLSHFIVLRRNSLSLASLILTIFFSIGAKNLYVNTNYNIFFDAEDARKIAHETQQEEFTKTDNLVLLIKSKNDESIFSKGNLTAVYELTEVAWQTPYVVRVDSLTNFQHSFAQGDDLVVQDLVPDLNALSDTRIQMVERVGLSEKRLKNRIVSDDGKTTLINITVELPPYPSDKIDKALRVEALKLRDQAIMEVADYGDVLKAASPLGITIHVLGETVINASLTKASDKDSATLIPLMFLAIVIILGVLLRSLSSIAAALMVIVLTIVASMGVNGWAGAAVNMVNIAAPIIILTIAVCDSVHLLSSHLDFVAKGEVPEAAMERSLQLNLQPIFITSVTTAVGFLTLNFSSSPPFRELGNLCAFGVIYAMFLTVFLLPSFAVKFLTRARSSSTIHDLLDTLAEIVIRRKWFALMIAAMVSILSMTLVSRNQIDDDPSRYFKSRNSYRAAMDFSQETLPGVNDINFTLDCESAHCINQPEFLRKVDEFGKWLLMQENIETVISYVDVIKKINSNFNSDSVLEYQIPEQAELIAQYNLLYELSLPFGLDLNNLTNYDKSATKLTAFVRQTNTGNFLDIEARARSWLRDNSLSSSPQGNSIRMMFAALGESNIRGMLWGALIALMGVTITILASLKSIKYSALSIIANSFPAIIALGFWGLLVGHINMAVAMVFSITLGIIVDDSVHFICKYRHARESFNMAPDDAIRYAFRNVGQALSVTTIVLAIGFGLLCFSDFNLNAYLGALTAMTVVIALIFDYLVLPPLLLIFDGGDFR